MIKHIYCNVYTPVSLYNTFCSITLLRYYGLKQQGTILFLFVRISFYILLTSLPASLLWSFSKLDASPDIA